MVLEFAILIVFDLGVLGHKGGQALPVAALSPHNVFSGSIGIALMFAFTSFVGFESAALYGEETENPMRSIPRATYVAVISVGVFYFLTTWFTSARSASTGRTRWRPGSATISANLLFNEAQTYVGDHGPGRSWACSSCTSVLASMLAIHNAASRYMFALGRERVLPRGLGASTTAATVVVRRRLTVPVVNAVVVLGVSRSPGSTRYQTLAPAWSACPRWGSCCCRCWRRSRSSRSSGAAVNVSGGARSSSRRSARSAC